jgi:hypothetical protein
VASFGEHGQVLQHPVVLSLVRRLLQVAARCHSISARRRIGRNEAKCATDKFRRMPTWPEPSSRTPTLFAGRRDLCFGTLWSGYGEATWHGHEFTSVHHQFIPGLWPWCRVRIAHHVITTRGFTRYDQPIAALLGVPDGVCPVTERLFELNSPWLAVELFWNNSYGCIRRHFSPSPRLNPTARIPPVYRTSVFHCAD